MIFKAWILLFRTVTEVISKPDASKEYMIFEVKIIINIISIGELCRRIKTTHKLHEMLCNKIKERIHFPSQGLRWDVDIPARKGGRSKRTQGNRKSKKLWTAAQEDRSRYGHKTDRRWSICWWPCELISKDRVKKVSELLII